MYDDLTSFEHNPSQKFCKHLNNFEKSQKFSKPQILGQKIWNAWLNGEKESYQRKEQILRPKIEWGSEFEWDREV